MKIVKIVRWGGGFKRLKKNEVHGAFLCGTPFNYLTSNYFVNSDTLRNSRQTEYDILL